MIQEVLVGTVAHFFQKPMVAAVRVEREALKAGDRIHFKGHSTDFYETADSLQVDHQPVPEGKAGDLVGLRVVERVREHDLVFKVVGEEAGT
jgi:translation elongation factor EF-Tu-like GTPase